MLDLCPPSLLPTVSRSTLLAAISSIVLSTYPTAIFDLQCRGGQFHDANPLASPMPMLLHRRLADQVCFATFILLDTF